MTFGGAGSDLARDGGALTWRGEQLIETAAIALRGGAQRRRTRWPPPRPRWPRGVERAAVAEALRTFRGVEHRLEHVAELGGVTWINDSKATNVASTIVALAALDAPAHVILGGEAQGQDFEALREPLARGRRRRLPRRRGRAAAARRCSRARCRCTTAAIWRRPSPPRTPRRAPGEVVLLSPACKSFDQFPGGFEERGARFKALVAALGG